MSNISSIKQSKSSTEKLFNAINALTQKKFQKDERYWTLTVDKAGNGYAEIRFLPASPVDGEDGVPISAPLWTHGFQGPSGQWYIENSLTTLGQQDPVSEYNSKLWATGIESNKKIASAQKRQLNYVSNILVVNDTAKPENNGKVFLYRYGKTIYDMIMERFPQSKKEGTFYPPTFKFFNPFDPKEGANFNLAARIGTNKRRTYDKSGFDAQSPVDNINELLKQTYSLTEVTDPKNFKTYGDLKSRLDLVLGLEGGSSVPLPSAEESVAAEVDDAVNTSIEDSDLEVFRKLADE